jgi:hypothetical protein
MFTIAAFTVLTDVPFQIPVKSASGSGDAAEPTGLASPAPAAGEFAAEFDWPPPPLEQDHPPSARSIATMTKRRRMDLPLSGAGTTLSRSSFARLGQYFLAEALDTFEHLLG